MFGSICVVQQMRDLLVQGNKEIHTETNEVYSGFVDSFTQTVGQFEVSYLPCLTCQ